MADHDFAGIRACVFDAYGTLFDYASAAARCLAELGGANEAERKVRATMLTALWRDKQLQYAWLRSLQGRHADFWQVTGDALGFAMATLHIAEPGLRDRLMNLYLTLDAFPEVPDMLRQLKRSGFATAILSNGSPAMLDAAVTSAGIGGNLDAVLSVEPVGIYKPSPRVYQLAVDRLNCAAGSILFVSSNGWDAHAASAFGMRAAWCNRDRHRDEHLPGAPDVEIRSLADLPGLLAA
ncbi:MAG: haloacid dehalogenase type II [Alphaproteobacteria bacterium]|nr:haloacid dehalogenase type II [Alphaproteobacteria bacterium]